jgi:hypothetical protein
MNALLFLLVAWFTLGVVCVIGSLWYMKTHEKQLIDDIPEAQIFGCIPPPAKWGVIFFMFFLGPVVLLWGICEAIRDSRKEKAESAVPGEPPAAATPPVVSPQSAWMVLFALVGAAFCAYDWATECPAKPLATFLEVQARTIGYFLVIFAVAGALGRGRPLHGLRELVYLLPFYLVGLIPNVASMTVGWQGGWLLGIAGAAVGAPAGTAAGWLFARWALPEVENRDRQRRRAIVLPIAFAVLFAIFGAYSWAIEWLTPEHAWVIGVGWILLALPGALVGRPFLGLLVAFPFVLVTLLPLVASMTVGWEGGWLIGIAGAAVGAAAGAVKGWLVNRWIMPEYDKRRARESAVRPPGSTDGPGSSASMAERL